MRSGKFMYFSLVFVLLLGCKTTQLGVRSTTSGLTSCRKPAEVHFAAASASPKKPAMVNGAKVDVGFFDFFHVEVSPSDFSKVDSHECNADGTCKTVFTKPIKVNVNVPVTLNSKISLSYQQAKAEEGNVCLRKVSVGTTVTPVCLGKILSLSVGVGATVTQATDLNTKKVTYDTKPYCGANLSCSLPFLSVGAHMDQKGLTFDNSIAAKTGVPGALVKLSAPVTKPLSVPFEDLPEDIQKLKQHFAGLSDSASAKATDNAVDNSVGGGTGGSDSDMVWEDFADNCAA